MFGPCWVYFGSTLGHLGPFRDLVGPSWGSLGPTMIGKICCQSASRFNKGVLGPSLRHFGVILGVKKVSHSFKMVSRWLKMAPTWPKVTRRWPNHGLSRPQDDPKMAQHKPLGPTWVIFGPFLGHFGANLVPLWAINASTCTPEAKI